jgi:hypothetical protein
MGKDWFRMGFFLMTSLFWTAFYRQASAVMLLVAIFCTFFSFWMIVQKTKEP